MSEIIIVDSIANRIKHAMKERNLKAVDVSERTGISQGSLSQYLNGRVEPKSDRIYMIAQALSVDPVWLMGIDVPMEKKLPDADKLAEITMNPIIVDYAWKLLNLEDAKKNVVLELIDHLSDKE